ncbi:MAG: cytochrome c oxidase subunit 2A [Saprospiraceae bacterium]
MNILIFWFVTFKQFNSRGVHRKKSILMKIVKYSQLFKY